MARATLSGVSPPASIRSYRVASSLATRQSKVWPVPPRAPPLVLVEHRCAAGADDILDLLRRHLDCGVRGYVVAHLDLSYDGYRDLAPVLPGLVAAELRKLDIALGHNAVDLVDGLVGEEAHEGGYAVP